MLKKCRICCETVGAGSEEEIQAAEEKFNESKLLAEAAMYNLLENDVCVIFTVHLFGCSFSHQLAVVKREIVLKFCKDHSVLFYV